MADDSVLAGFDPFDVLDREAVRLDAFLSTLRNNEWATQSRCPGWTTRHMLAHLAAAEDYYRACLEGTVAEYMAAMTEQGASDLDAVNDIGVAQFLDRDPHEVLDVWRSANFETRQGFRARGNGMVDTLVGQYPGRWQAFHIAAEMATHADDIHVPIADDEDELRWAWRVAFSRFALTEAKPDVVVEPVGDKTLRVQGAGVDFEVSEHDLMEGVMGRLGESSALSAEQRELLRYDSD
jgi:uncharacterized protein (TIGR03083 family)